MSNLTNFEKLMAEGNLEEARKALTEMVSAPLSPEDRGRTLVGLVTFYIKSKNQINKDFLKELKVTIESIRSVGGAEQVVKDQINLNQVRSKLA
jgi:hypothetical protein